MPTDDLVVVLRAKTDEFRSKMAGAAGSTDKLSKSQERLRKVGRVAGLALLGAAGAAVAIGGKAIDAASDLQESQSKVNVVFGKSAASITKWSETASSKLLMTQQQALEAAGTFGNLFRAMGIGIPTAAKMSKSVIQLATDLASFNNANPEDVLLALKSGLVGETEPLRAFGVNLNAARIEAEALNLGLAKAPVNMVKVRSATIALEKAQTKATDATKEYGAESLEARDAATAVARAQQGLETALGGSKVELDASQKAQAAYSLILKDTKLAQGDAARTADGFANQSKRLKAQIGDLSAKIGVALLPIVKSLMTFITDKGIPALSKAHEWFGKHKTASKALAVVLGGVVLTTIVAYTASMITAAAATIAATWPILAVIAVAALLAVGAAKLGVTWDRVWRGMQRTASWPVIKQAIALIGGAIFGVWGALQYLGAHWGGIWERVTDITRGAMQQIVRVINGIITAYNALPFVDDAGLIGMPTEGGGPYKRSGPMGPFPNYRPGRTDIGGHGPAPPYKRSGPMGPRPPAPPTRRGLRATGGPVMPWNEYLVGERGPELLTMGSSSGRVHPNASRQPIILIVELDGKQVARTVVDQSNRQGGLPIRIRTAS